MGGLVAIGIPPQFMDAPPPTDAKRGAIMKRARFWLEVFDEFGQLNETGIHVLNQRPGFPPGYPGLGYSGEQQCRRIFSVQISIVDSPCFAEVFFSQLEGPRNHLAKGLPDTPSFSLFADAHVNTTVTLPPVFESSSNIIVLFGTPAVSSLSVEFPGNTTATPLTQVSLFAASARVVLTMRGAPLFSEPLITGAASNDQCGAVSEALIFANGSRATNILPARRATVTVALSIGERVVYKCDGR